MFDKGLNIEYLHGLCKSSMLDHLGIEFIEIGENYIKARMPVDHRTRQPHGILHGGASVAFAESLAGVASNIYLNSEEYHTVGLEINANHVRTVKDGFVYGIVSPLHLGKMTQIWEIKITNEADKLVCISRITLAIIKR